jgi:hypothetical protein
MRLRFFATFFALSIAIGFLFAQELFTARGYWRESTREPYLSLTRKQLVGDSLSVNEAAYLQDYGYFLDQYFTRLPETEKQRYFSMKAQWDRELSTPAPPVAAEEFEWRGRDRFLNALYGTYYGITVVAIAELDNAAAAGIPLLTGGLWMLGPVINPKKYEGITQTTVRAGHSGKLLGLIYGLSAGLAIAGDSENNGDFMLGFSTLGSIAMGEIGFQLQKKRNLTDGQVELIRHYSILGTGVGLSLIAATESEHANLYGLSMLAGGIGGIAVGNGAYKRYNYTKGDVDAISSLSLIGTGLGFTAIIEQLDEADYSSSLFLVPAAGALVGSYLAQRSVKGIHLTKKQGSTIAFATAGSSLMGLGILALAESDSPAAWIGVPSAMALVVHQLVFNKYKRENLARGMQGTSRYQRTNFAFSFQVMPENYFINQRVRPNSYDRPDRGLLPNSIVRIGIRF